jgi:hypothetical protein
VDGRKYNAPAGRRVVFDARRPACSAQPEVCVGAEAEPPAYSWIRVLMAVKPLQSGTDRPRRSSSSPGGDSVVQTQSRDARWRVRAAWKERLLAADAPDWFALEGEDRAERAKSGHQRSVWRVKLDEAAVYAKVLDTSGWIDRLKRWCLSDPARREWAACREAEARGVPVIRALAVGERCGAGLRTVLLSEELEGAATLPEVWARDVSAAAPGSRRCAAGGLIEAVSRLFAVSHERGIGHRDAHPGNILIREAAGGTYEASYVDLHAATVRRGAMRRPWSLRALAQLDHYFQRLASRTERLRFLRAYEWHRRHHGAQPVVQASERVALAAISQARQAHAERLARQRDRRLRRSGKYFCTMSLGGGWRATVVLTLERRHVFPEADVPDRQVGEWAESLRPALANLLEEDAAGAAEAVPGLRLEVTRPGGFLSRVHWTIWRPPALRAFEQCHRRRHRDLKAELILGYAEHASGGLVDGSVLIRPQPGPKGDE